MPGQTLLPAEVTTAPAPRARALRRHVAQAGPRGGEDRRRFGLLQAEAAASAPRTRTPDGSRWRRAALGRSDLQVPPLCLRLQHLRLDGGRGDVVPRCSMRCSIAGLTFLDTADVYSRWAPGHTGGESEAIIGRWMEGARLPRPHHPGHQGRHGHGRGPGRPEAGLHRRRPSRPRCGGCRRTASTSTSPTRTTRTRRRRRRSAAYRRG